jgi:hypothetical protein
MTVEDIKARVLGIDILADQDPKAAHLLEDKLFEDVLIEIVKTARSPNAIKPELLAAAALQSLKLDFVRCCY